MAYKIDKNGKIQYIEISWADCRKVDLTGRKKKYNSQEIRTIHYYGSKSRFQKLFLEIFRYCKDSLGCSTFADAFTGSGILSLLASKAGYEVYMNDGLDLIVNFHHLMKGDYQKFYAFMYFIQVWDSYFYGDFDRQKFKKLGEQLEKRKSYYKNKKELLDNIVKSGSYDPKRVKQVQKKLADCKQTECRQRRKEINSLIEVPKSRYTELADMIEAHIDIKRRPRYRGYVSVRWAVLYYLYRQYTFLGRTSYSPTAKPAVFNILDLVNARQYYGRVKEIDNLSYKKFSSRFLFDEKSLVMLDPPYVQETRSDQRAYKRWEFSEKQQRYFLEHISQSGIKAKIIVCGYSNSFYDRRLHKYNLQKGCHWQKVRLLKAGSVKLGPKEVIWVNFDFTTLESKYPQWFEVVPESEWDYSYRK